MQGGMDWRRVVFDWNHVRSFLVTADDSKAYLSASPKYLESLGPDLTRESLSRATFIGFDHGEAYRTGLAALGLRLTAENFPIVCKSQHVHWGLAREGLGIAIMLAAVGDREPAVRRVLPDLPPIVVPTWLVTHNDLRSSRRVRVVADLLAAALG